MSADKLVDSTQLDSDLTSVANAIRAKGGTSAQLAFPTDFVSAINAISGGGGGTGYTLLASGSETYTGAAASTLNISVSYTGTPVFGYAVADEIIASTNQAYGFLAITSDFPGMDYFQYHRVGVTSAVNTSGTVNTQALNLSNEITSTQFKIGRVNNTYLIQPNKYNWFIYGVAT